MLRTHLVFLLTVVLCLESMGTCDASTDLNPKRENTNVVALMTSQGFLPLSAFEEPLTAFGNPKTEETEALKIAADSYSKQTDISDVTVFDNFLKTHPNTVWRISLQAQLGLTHYNNGAFSEAFTSWEDAWSLGKKATDAKQKAVVDFAFGQLVRMHARLGHAEELTVLLDEVKNREFSGPATEMVSGAKDALWLMHNEPGVSYLCGPAALKNTLASINPNDKGIAQLESARSGMHGFNLSQVNQLAKKINFPYQMAYRVDNAPIPVPSVVHWKVHHYAAVVAEENGRYHIKDPTFGDDLWVPKAVLDKETSGYFMVPKDKIGEGWRQVSVAEANKVYGMGTTATSDDSRTGCCDEMSGNSPPTPTLGGMPQYSVHAMLVSLHIADLPLGYTPPKGPNVNIVLTYNQREAEVLTGNSFFNLGTKWTFNWLSYIQDDGTTANVKRFAAGGGRISYTGYNSTTGEFTPEKKLGATLDITSTNPYTYERRLSDGGKEIYQDLLVNVAGTRKFFLTQVIDPQGNAVTLHYDAQKRLTSITDALNQSTVLSYENISYPLQITKITDPFLRFTQIGYYPDGKLKSITDAEGMQTIFTYLGTTDFIDSMTTPYGKTLFAFGEDSTTSPNRWLEITDPKGLKERTEFLHSAPGIPTADTLSVPTGISNINSYINQRNSFYWDKHAYSLYGSGTTKDYTKAVIKHFLHTVSNQTSGVLESVKYPLESRIWYNYPGQASNGIYEGTSEAPVSIGRIVDDSSGNGTTATQLTKKTYNSLNKVTSIIDPLGNTITFEYYPNNIDLHYVRRKNTSGTYDVLKTYGAYNSQHRPSNVTDALNHTTSFLYDADGHLTEASDIVNGITLKTNYTYLNSYLWKITDANGVDIETYTYDNVGRVHTKTNALGYTDTYDYDNLNRLKRITYPDSTYREYGYDKLDIATEKDQLGNIKNYHFDEVRNLYNVQDPLLRYANYTYWENGELKTSTEGVETTKTFDIDIQSRVYGEHQGAHNTTTIYETTTSRINKITNSMNLDTKYLYDLADRIKKVIDPHNAITQYFYDSLGRPNRISSPDSGSTTFDTYDLNDNLKLKTTGNGVQVNYDYDELHRVKSITYQ